MGARAATTSEPLSGSLIEWAVAARAMPGEMRSGDLHVVAPFDDGVLVGVIDGLGHGDEAADAAACAADVLRGHPSEPLLPLMRRCHEALRMTRGAAISLACFAPSRATGAAGANGGAVGRMSWIGVGNVEGSIFRSAVPARESMLLRGGVVGYRLPELRMAEVRVARGDTLVLATDGIDEAHLDLVKMPDDPSAIVRNVLAHARDTDDALVLVARYRGEDEAS